MKKRDLSKHDKKQICQTLLEDLIQVSRDQIFGDDFFKARKLVALIGVKWLFLLHPLLIQVLISVYFPNEIARTNVTWNLSIAERAVLVPVKSGGFYRCLYMQSPKKLIPTTLLGFGWSVFERSSFGCCVQRHEP